MDDALVIFCPACGVHFEGQSVLTKCPECGVRGELVATSARTWNATRIVLSSVDLSADVALGIASDFRAKLPEFWAGTCDPIAFAEERAPELASVLRNLIPKSATRSEIINWVMLVIALLTAIGILPPKDGAQSPDKIGSVTRQCTATGQLMPQPRVDSSSVARRADRNTNSEPPLRAQASKPQSKGSAKVGVKKNSPSQRAGKRQSKK